MSDADLSLRIGHGYDLHRLEYLKKPGLRLIGGNGRPLVVGGVRLESELGPVAHSDGDALLHAVTDAILSAAGLEDIGQLFPDNDPANEGRDSMDFVRAAMVLVRGAGFEIVNVDATVVLDQPKLSPHKAVIRATIAGGLGLTIDRVNVKGKTHEARNAGKPVVEVHAVALLRRPGRANEP